MQALTILVVVSLAYLVAGRPFQTEISHLQDEVQFLRSNLSALWEIVHEHDQLHGIVRPPRPYRSVVRETRNHRVHLHFHLDIPGSHPGQEDDCHNELNPVASVTRETREHRVNMDFYMNIPDHPATDPVRSVERETEEHHVNMDFFLDIPYHTPPHDYVVTSSDSDHDVCPMRSVVMETTHHMVSMDFFLDVPDHPSEDEDRHVATTEDQELHYAHCQMEPNPNQLASLHHHVHGSIEMSQRGTGDLTMYFHLTGFNVSDDFEDHNHGLQIHEYGDMEHGCDTIGELYHGEHVQGHANPGDLGDLHDDDRGTVTATRSFDWLRIDEDDGILGRSLAILQGDHTSHTSIIACCVIGRSHAH
ncbi:uncharacterized protein LOC133188538 isoform X2 [Saccostrea echinata]|uniref:uncharacterized protein LOC133188538 isoform X2 n=1 Tax=Saccostrea echinata TaxID=191078 RepID=UPI002A805AA4|nr:uncharacterized protein LOC133188538 isoform X2 [Saccostrea echinata]